jgi:tetratricopeptide (TPR) repeat protein
MMEAFNILELRPMCRVLRPVIQSSGLSLHSYCKAIVLLFALASLLFIPLSALAQNKGYTQDREPIDRGSRVSRTPTTANTTFNAAEFEKLTRDAEIATKENRLDEAVALYRRGVAARPGWGEGWWLLATLLYDKDDYPNAVKAFGEAVRIEPKSGAAWAMLGLCEYKTGAYKSALAHLQKGRSLGFVGNGDSIGRVVLYHEALLLLLGGAFEQSQQILDSIAYGGASSENLILALGLASLRFPILPENFSPSHPQHEVVRRAGFAAMLAAKKEFVEAAREYERLATDFPRTPEVQYTYGRYLFENRNPDEKAIAAFEKEIENSPNHLLARLQIASLKLKNKEAASGLPFAEQAVKLNAQMPQARYIFGRLLFEAGQTERAITELEAARKLAPAEPKVHFALARVYARANRKKDAEDSRRKFEDARRALEATGGVKPDADSSEESNAPSAARSSP